MYTLIVISNTIHILSNLKEWLYSFVCAGFSSVLSPAARIYFLSPSLWQKVTFSGQHYQEGQGWHAYLNFPTHLRFFSVSNLWLAHSSPYICFFIVLLTLSILFIPLFLWLAIAFQGYKPKYSPKPHSVLPSSHTLLSLTYLNFSSLGVLFQEHDSYMYTPKIFQKAIYLRSCSCT